MAKKMDGKAIKERLVKILGAEELRSRIGKIEMETGGLLDYDALLGLIADAEGELDTSITPLAELKPGNPVFTQGIIEEIGAVREFRTREKIGKLRKIILSDGKTHQTVTMWDEETGIVEQLGLKEGSRVRLMAAEMRTSKYGNEVHIGKTGFFVVDDAIPGKKPTSSPPDGPRTSIKGVILSFQSTGKGRQRTVAIKLFDGTGEYEITVPGILVKSLEGVRAGVEIVVENATVTVSAGKKTLQCDGITIIRLL